MSPRALFYAVVLALPVNALIFLGMLAAHEAVSDTHWVQIVRAHD